MGMSWKEEDVERSVEMRGKEKARKVRKRKGENKK